MANVFASGSRKRKKSVGHKRIAYSDGKTLKANFFPSDETYNKYFAIKEKHVSPLKCWDLPFLQHRHLHYIYSLLDEYKLIKFVTYNAECYPRLVRMFYANLAVAEGKGSNYVMNKKVVVDIETLVKAFDMDGEAPFHLSKDLQEYNREDAIKLLFPENPPNVVTGKIMTTGLSVEDRLLHYTIVKCILPRATNTTNIVEDELFLLWAFKQRIPLNIPYLIINYMGTFASRTPSFLPYGIILTAIFHLSRVPSTLEKEIINSDSSTWINETTFHNMQLRLVQGVWVRGDGSGGRRRADMGASSSAPAGGADFSDEAMNLLRNLTLRQEEMFKTVDLLKGFMQEGNQKIYEQQEAMETKMEEGFSDLHSRLNTLKSQLNEIQSQVTPEE